MTKIWNYFFTFVFEMSQLGLKFVRARKSNVKDCP